jgi:hypothetical protein
LRWSGLLKARTLFVSEQLERWHRYWLAICVDRHHCEIAAVCMADKTPLNVLGHHTDPNFHRTGASVVNGREERDQFTNVNWLKEHDLIDR